MIFTVTFNPALDKEYTVTNLKMDEVLRASSIKIDYGGKGFNVSRMLASLETESVAIGLLGGATGELLQVGLSSIGVETDPIWISSETRTNISIVSNSDIHHIKVNEPGPIISPDEISNLMKKIESLIQPGDWWVLAGSLPAGVHPGIYGQIITMINAGGAKTILDACGQPLMMGCQAEPFLVKPNIYEATQLTSMLADTPEQILDIASSIHGMGARNVIISSGKKRSLLSDGEGRWFGSSPPIDEMNSVGAGDAMVAGLVWRLEKGDPIKNAFPWGIACGTAAASQPGTGMASRSQIEQLIPKILVEEV
jgi:1-phosphofructokinase family hexose kinase